MERANDHHEEIAAFVRRLQEAGIFDSQIDPYVLSHALTPLELIVQESFNRGTNTLSDPAPHFRASHAFNELQLNGHEVMQRMAADHERRRREILNYVNYTLSPLVQRSGVSQATISRLRCYNHTQETAAGRKDDTFTCSICLGEVEIGQNVRVLTCEHEFHAPCVDKWLLDHHTCPICRSTVQ